MASLSASHIDLFKRVGSHISHIRDVFLNEGISLDVIGHIFSGQFPRKHTPPSVSLMSQRAKLWRHEIFKKGSPLNEALLAYVERFDPKTTARPGNLMDWEKTGHLPHEKLGLGWEGLMTTIANLPMPDTHRRRRDQDYVYSRAMVLDKEGKFVEKDVIGISIGRCSTNMDATLERMLRKAMDRGLHIPPRPDGKPWHRDMRIPKGKSGDAERKMLGAALCRKKDSPFLVAHKLAANSEIMLNDKTAILASEIHPNLSSEKLAESFFNWKRSRILKINDELKNKLSVKDTPYYAAIRQERVTLQKSFQFGSLAQFRSKTPAERTPRIIEQRPALSPEAIERMKARRTFLEHQLRKPPAARNPMNLMEKSPIIRNRGLRPVIKGAVTNSGRGMIPSSSKKVDVNDLIKKGLSLSPESVNFRLTDDGNVYSALSIQSSERSRLGIDRGEKITGASAIDMRKLSPGEYRILRDRTLDYGGTLRVSLNGAVSLHVAPNQKIVLSGGVKSYLDKVNKEVALKNPSIAPSPSPDHRSKPERKMPVAKKEPSFGGPSLSPSMEPPSPFNVD